MTCINSQMYTDPSRRRSGQLCKRPTTSLTSTAALGPCTACRRAVERGGTQRTSCRGQHHDLRTPEEVLRKLLEVQCSINVLVREVPQQGDGRPRQLGCDAVHELLEIAPEHEARGLAEARKQPRVALLRLCDRVPDPRVGILGLREGVSVHLLGCLEGRLQLSHRDDAVLVFVELRDDLPALELRQVRGLDDEQLVEFGAAELAVVVAVAMCGDLLQCLEARCPEAL
mmetsp:Transcript_151756/g.486895  ORF Transcript_151756/g.486895 Transcript_151756/m.486895 type:complete len:228 (-) Transcript_151756:3105-3788(-)|eukprot:CAMPEP_0203883182 /NCGR_PEP_ID=MMETSP0359-20131031/27305_1 /ASSEMBLY_ACC=CAM_ASM_000338 /TAXON_ID=268821 /ORGANISM="Scrippsiella Hangoei, Strain SHTV-5" /LENGTH=227 /DNA_ID=CAMNT_0050803351 /DNA_START=53 /DNA_END=736 /DNA_ORIENTATION=+